MATSAKVRAKRHAHVKKSWETDLPRFNPIDYRMSLLHTLYAFRNLDDAVCKDIGLAYFKAQGFPATTFKGISDGSWNQIAALSYLHGKGLLNEEDAATFERKATEFVCNVPSTKKVEKDQPAKRNVQDFVVEKARAVMAEIDEELDRQWYGRPSTIDTKAILAKHEVSAPVAKVIASTYKPSLREMKDVVADKDEQLVEAYQHVTYRHCQKYADLLSSVIGACENTAVIARATRKPRARKVKPPSVVAAKVQVLREIPALKLKTVDPAKVVGATEAWIFNAKYRKLVRYVAQDGMTLTWKGTTLQNWCPEQSGGKTVRKPEVFFKGIDAMTKRPLVKAFNDIRAVYAKPKGRASKETIIVKVF